MPPKKAAVTKLKKSAAANSWAAVGIDTSMSSIAVVGIGYDATTKKMSAVMHKDIRWTTEDYYVRLRDAANSHKLVLDVLANMWVVDLANIHIAIEEPFPLGMIGRAKNMSGFIKQQCEIAGCVKGSLARYGFNDIAEINNAQWKRILREDGVDLSDKESMKWEVKQWAIDSYGLPDLPDLVNGKSGSSKIPRPESGWGANAKAVQPDDIYDACAIMEWMRLDLEERGLAN